MKVVINGATGWLGLSAAHALKRTGIAQNANDITFLGGTSRKSQLGPWGLVQVHGVGEVNELDFTSEMFVQLAFKTRDYISRLGELEYIRINREIIKNSISLLKKSGARHVVIVSSGVVSRFLSTRGQLDQSAYTALKIEEEQAFTETCRSMSSRLVILRLWGATGSDMTEPLKYAVGDLIRQAITNREILISSDRLVYRRYVDSRDVMEIAMRASLLEKNVVLDSGGAIIEMAELAHKIRNLFSPRKRIIRPKLRKVQPDIYFSTSTQMEEFAEKFEMTTLSLDEQLLETKDSVIRSLKR